MKIHKARLNHATNSSSTHSIVRVNPKDIPGDSGHENNFGWNHFTASSKESKNNYFAYILAGALRNSVGGDITEILVKDLCGEIDRDGYIDHQSELGLPRSFSTNTPDIEFAKDFQQFLLRDDIVILGGNDNTDVEHPLASVTEEIETLPRYGTWGSICRKDKKGHWTLFSKHTGAKVRFSFDDQEVPSVSTFPELIDIKITDWCAEGCEYCYQGSTTKGKHANSSYISSVAHTCSEMKVFEVAIGGGEPTAHPSFTHILRTFKQCGVTASFSTRSLAWMKNTKKAREISELCGSWAFSVDKAMDVRNALSAATEAGIKKPVIHIVFGANPWETTEDLIRLCSDLGLDIVLLGFKTTGRGNGAKVYDCSKWISLLDDLRCRVSIDTCVAAQFAQELADSDIPEWLLERKEGCHSMYIDAVAQTMGPSSFCHPSKMSEYRPYQDADKITAGLEAWSKETPLEVLHG